MDNAGKLQDVSKEHMEETPEEVQKVSELHAEKAIEKEEEKDKEETAPVVEDESSKEDYVKNEVTTELRKELIGITKGKKKVAEIVPEQSPIRVPETQEELFTNKIIDTTSEKNTEVDSLSDDTDELHNEEEEQLDFSHAEKAELLSKLREMKNEDEMHLLDRVLKATKLRFDELYQARKNEALSRFVSEGNEADAFEFHGDELEKEFIVLHGQLKSKRNKHYKDLQNLRDDNLKKKERLLEQLRTIVDGEESNQSINSVRELQTEWKKIGPVPGTQNKTLWASYNALLDRYYDHRSIYFELKDLDRKKNMGLKLDLCEKAEALSRIEDLKIAIAQLNELHEEYKHIGPVPKENQEPLWQRFKAASDAVYAKRKEYFEGLKVQFEANQVKKEALIKEVESFLEFNSDRITEWNAKTKEILELQKRWEMIGGIPKENAKAVNKAFWNSFKKFFSLKNQFFKELEGKREENLLKKQELIQKAEELQESTEWDSTAQKLKKLQLKWKEIGPVPEKTRKETYDKFKVACDHFFNKRREQNKEKFRAYDENLTLKLQICDQIEALTIQDTIVLDDVYDMVDNYTSVGFVPKSAIKKISKRFEEVVGKVLSLEVLDEQDRSDLRRHIEFGRLKNIPGGNQKIQRKENSIKRKISTLENDISTWNTNMEFFANSVAADKLKADMQNKIKAAEKELLELKTQLTTISS
ncbi:MAG: DUF349 domain-containing protein [Bacteroidota bacterium]